MKKILIISGTDKVSGAEYVLKDYVVNSKYRDNIDILCSNMIEVKSFYNTFCNKVIAYNGLNPVNATISKFAIKNKIKKVINIVQSNRYINNLYNINRYRLVIGNNTRDIVYSTLIEKNKGIKFYLFVHDMILPGTINYKLIKIFNKNVDKYIVVSKAVFDSLVKSGVDRERIVLQYNGLNYMNLIKKQRNNPIKIGYIGALIERKSPETMIELIKSSNFTGYMAFNYYDENIYNNIKKDIIKNNLKVELLGKVDREKINNFIREMDFIFVPSKEDPLPTVVLESFNNSTPVIGREIDGIPEMIENNLNGLLFKNNSDLKDIIKKINNLSEENYLDMSKNSNVTIKDKFNIEKKAQFLDNFLF